MLIEERERGEHRRDAKMNSNGYAIALWIYFPLTDNLLLF